MGYDDAISIAKREGIREHLIQQALRGLAERYHASTTAFAEETDNYVESITQKPVRIKRKGSAPAGGVLHDDAKALKPVNEDLMYELPIRNLLPIGNNSYRGSTFASHVDALKGLKKAGITTLIDFCNSGDGYRIDVENAGLRYINFICTNPYGNTTSDGLIFNDMAFYKLSRYINNLKKKYGEDFVNTNKKFLEDNIAEFNRMNREFIDKFIDVIRAMYDGRCYIGCSFGEGRTTNTLDLIHFFNPKGRPIPENLDPYEVNDIDTLYKKLTPEDKIRMHWTKEFEKKFLANLERALRV